VYQQTFKKGKPVTEVVVVKAAPKFQGKAWKSGTVVEWETDFSCFDKGAKVDPKAIFAWLKSVSWFVTSPKGNKRVPITFNYDINGKTGTIVAKSLRAYVEQRVAKLKDVEIMEDTFMVDRTDGCDFVGAWTTSPDSLFDSACNAAPTTDGGTHLKGAMRAVEDAFRKIAKKSQVFKQADLLAGFIGTKSLLCRLSHGQWLSTMQCPTQRLQNSLHRR
jgi:DNA gyrase/topoisomerase IV subunit B